MDAPLWTEWAYVTGVGICGACPRLYNGIVTSNVPWCFRPSDFRLHRRDHKKTQVFPWARTLTIASDEDLDPRLDDLFLHHVNVQRRHVDLCGYGEG